MLELNSSCTVYRLLHEQMLHENPHETILEKRVNILKSQLFQLERQVIIVGKASDLVPELSIRISRWLFCQTWSMDMQEFTWSCTGCWRT